MARKIQLCALIVFSFLFSSKIFAHPIDEIIKQNTDFQPAITAISIKNVDTDEILYQKNEKTLVHPASTLKLITANSVLEFLGADYQFKTAIYKRWNKVYLKVGADPLLTYSDLQNLVSQYKKSNSEVIRTLAIDDTIIDKTPFGIGWQWDDNANPKFPAISPYIVNHNLFPIKVKVARNNAIFLEPANEYREPLVNKLTYGQTTDVKAQRNLFEANPKVVLYGTVDKSQILSFPAKNPQLFFNNVLMCAFLMNNISVNPKFKYAKLPKFPAQEAIVTHSITDVLKAILNDSDNLSAEVLIRHAGYIKTEKTGTTNDGLDIVKNYYIQRGLNIDNIQIVDGSGASMNDYVSADFMTEALKIIYSSRYYDYMKNLMTNPSNGTFKGRLPELNGNIKVKTGTLANTSAVIGFIKTKSGKNLVFAIMLDNLPKNTKPKEFENEIIKGIYNL